MSLKVLHLMDSGGLYGAEKMLLALVKEQLKQGLNPMILSAGEHGIEEKPVEAEARRLGLPITPWRMKPGLNLRAMKELVRWAKDEGYELFHSHGYKFNILLAAMPRKELGGPTVATLHGYVHAKRFSKMWLYELVDRWAIQRMDAVVLVSEAMRREVGDDLGHKTVVVPNGLDIASVRATADLPLVPEIQRFRDRHAPLVVSVGRLSAEKGFDRLLSAFAVFRKTNRDAGLLLVGEGAQREALSQQTDALRLKEHVLMPGYSDQVAACIRAADVLAIPSRTEGLPITLLEAMAVGTLVVASGVGAIPQVLGHGRGGYIVDNVTPDTLSKALEEAWKHEVNERTRSSWAMNQIEQHFSAQTMCEAYRSVYDRAESRCL